MTPPASRPPGTTRARTHGCAPDPGCAAPRTARRTILGVRSPILERLKNAVPALLLLLASNAFAAIDPFYEGLLRRGTDAFNRRDFPEAVKLLRLACFGMLDEPLQLVDGLTRLALAQAAANDREGFAETFARLDDVEVRFGAWRAADIPEEVRVALLRQAARILPSVTLQGSVLSQPAASSDGELERLPAAKRRAELERRIDAAPNEPRWRLVLARLDLDEGRTAEARRGVETVLTLAPGNSDALYLRGLVFAAREQWPLAVTDLRASGRASGSAEGATAMLRGLLALQRRDDARAFLAELPPAVRTDPAVDDLARQAGAD